VLAGAEPKKAVPNVLEKFLATTISTTGPISLSSYMRQCLTNPSGGYYINRDPFGRAGDFITSPEISQMFGELVGIWFLTQWMTQGRPKKFRLVELGPGRGTLMDDLLRVSMLLIP
jgi:SAM-dependent MidA family methyltransferase